MDDHHIQFYLEQNHPITICVRHRLLHLLRELQSNILIQTDDILPFRNSLLGEYALLMAQPPLGLGLQEDVVSRVAKMSMECRFGVP